MSKKTKLILVALSLLFLSSSLWSVSFSGSFPVTFRWSCSFLSGKGNSGEGVEPTLVFKEEGEGKVSITLPPFIYTEDKAFGAMTIRGVAVTEGKKGELKFSLKEFKATDGVNEVNGSSVSGTWKDGKLELKVKYGLGKMPFDISLKYEN